jgi:hypothetical protein
VAEAVPLTNRPQGAAKARCQVIAPALIVARLAPLLPEVERATAPVASAIGALIAADARVSDAAVGRLAAGAERSPGPTVTTR